MPKLTQDQLAERWHISPRTLEQRRWLGKLTIKDNLILNGRAMIEIEKRNIDLQKKSHAGKSYERQGLTIAD